MEVFDLITSTGRHYNIRLPDPDPDQKSAYVFAFHKSGSTLIHDMLTAYCGKIGVPTFSLFDEVFNQGVSTQQIEADAVHCFRENGYIYTGFRHFPNFDIPLRGAPTVLLARDPRDMLVSLYYSIRTSHVIPAGNQSLKQSRLEASEVDINEFVLRRKWLYTKVLRRYREALAGSDLTVYRYEDVIYQKKVWLTDLAEKLGLKVTPGLIDAVSELFDIFPEDEDDQSHIRQVHPGNYRKKLSATTIRELDEAAGEFLNYFGYES